MTGNDWESTPTETADGPDLGLWAWTYFVGVITGILVTYLVLTAVR